MKEWIMELCPEIAEWQAELIEQQALNVMLAEREACAKRVEVFDRTFNTGGVIAGAIRARGQG